MDLNSIMILINGEDKTSSINSIQYKNDFKILIKFKNNSNTYSYNKENVVILDNPKIIELDGSVAYIDGNPINDPKFIIDFGLFIRVIDCNKRSITIKKDQFSVLKNGAENKDAQSILDYLRDISKYISDNSSEESFLNKQMNDIKFVHPESVLSCYLNRQKIEARKPDINSIIFPFRFNLSQKAALENALENSISVIEGPPGTGKTQTILNLIANLVAVQNKSVAVVSNNNEAVKNVIEKMSNKGYGFLTALLGKSSNQDDFFNNLPIAKVEGLDCEETKTELINKIEEINIKLNELLKADRKRAQLCQDIRSWKLEQAHFEEYYSRQDIEEIEKLPLFRATSDRIISFLAENYLAKENNTHNKLIYKLKMFFKYGVFNYKNLEEREISILLSLQREVYRHYIKELEDKRLIQEDKLEGNSFNDLLNEHQLYSEKLFNKFLYKHYSKSQYTNFNKKNFKYKFEKFIGTFPVILSTTHALRNSILQNYILDYVIIDEASQVDIITGVLAFSCCRNVIIVGDIKQLPQITNEKIESKLITSPPTESYNYFQNNILSSIINLYRDDLPRTILREHYRCHPQIIEFCNQKYYDGELITYTDANEGDCPLVLYKTSEGNHMRSITNGYNKGSYNQRELDVTVQEILKNPKFTKNNGSIGFVTPYRKQADKAGSMLNDEIQSDTVHKYQGREKDIMIMSTVLDNTNIGKNRLNFVDDPQMLNVAVSRAIKQFVLVTDDELFFNNGNDIRDLIRYIQYSTLDDNIIDSNVVSIFDLLYKKYSSKLDWLKVKMDNGAKFKSEEAMRVLLDEILSEPRNKHYNYVREHLLRNLLNNVELLDDEELRFVNNNASLDFVIYYKQNKSVFLVIEVDGFNFHENNPEQQRRDRLKNNILEKYKIKLLRLSTNGSGEREKVQNILDMG